MVLTETEVVNSLKRLCNNKTKPTERICPSWILMSGMLYAEQALLLPQLLFPLTSEKSSFSSVVGSKAREPF